MAADEINQVAQGQNDRAEALQGNATQTMMELGALETQADDDSQLIQQVCLLGLFHNVGRLDKYYVAGQRHVTDIYTTLQK